MYPPSHPLAGQLHTSSGQIVSQQVVGPQGQVMNVAPQMGGVYPGGAVMGPQYLVQQYPGHYQVCCELYLFLLFLYICRTTRLLI